MLAGSYARDRQESIKGVGKAYRTGIELPICWKAPDGLMGLPFCLTLAREHTLMQINKADIL